MQDIPSTTFTAPTANQPPAVVPMAANGPPANPAAPRAAVPGPQVVVGPQIVVDQAQEIADDPERALEQPNISSFGSPDPEFMVRPTNTNGVFFSLLTGHAIGVAQGVNPLAERDQMESHSRQFPNYDQAFGYYMAHYNLGLVRIVPAAPRQPPPPPGTGLNPVYIASNAPTPEPVSPGLFGNPISVPTTPFPVNPSTPVKPTAKPAPLLEHAAKPTTNAITKPAFKLTAKPAILKQAPSKSAPKVGISSGVISAAPRPYLLAPPPKPINLPAPSQKTPTPAHEPVSEQPPKKMIWLGTVRVLGSDSESDELPNIPNYPSTPRLATPGPSIRPFPAPSPLSSEGVPDTPPSPVNPANGKKRFIPLYDDDNTIGPTQKKVKPATAPGPFSPSAKGSAQRLKIIEAAFRKHEQFELQTAPLSPSSIRAEATSSTAALTSPLPVASTSTLAAPSTTTFTAYRSVGVMSPSPTFSYASAASSSTALEMDTDLSELDSTDIDNMTDV